MTALPLALALLSAAPPNGWAVRELRDGVLLESRDVPGSSFEELRLTTRSTADLTRLCDAVFDNDPRTPHPGFVKRETLAQGPGERWTYEQVAVPLLGNRDYTLHVKREDAADGGCHIGFDTENGRGPPPQRGLVRINAIRGTWEIARAPDGGARVVYVVYSEPGGGLPAFLTRGSQRAHALAWMKVILARASNGPQGP